MTLRRSSAPGRDRSDRLRSLPILLLMLVAVLAAACGGASTTDAPTDAPTSEPTTSDEPVTTDDATEEPAASDEPIETDEPAESVEPTDAPSEEPTESATAVPTPAPGSASACAGDAGNQDFYMSVAAAVDWTVYCPVLPDGWFVESGQYRLAGGGRMEIGYRGPGGARLTLSEGAFCSDGDGCAPSGTEAGTAAFGDLEGTLVATDDGGWAIVVDAGQKPSWLLVGTGMSEAAFTKIGAGLVAVGG